LPRYFVETRLDAISWIRVRSSLLSADITLVKPGLGVTKKQGKIREILAKTERLSL
jgi:hypothetical protein